MKIQVKIDRIVTTGSTKAIASATLDGRYVVKGLRVVDGRKGLFVAMPQESYTDRAGNKKYSDLFFPITNAAKTELQDAVLNAYMHTPQQVQSDQWQEVDGGILPFEL